MFYFVPAWYGNSRKWHKNTPFWFRVLDQMAFDDSICQMRLFLQAQEKAAFLILNYQPQLRYFLHKQGVQEAVYWNFFDDIQNIHRKAVRPFSFRSLNWPKGSRFLYTPFAVVVQKEEEVVARVQFAENGNVLLVEWIKNQQADKDYLFDDRGFLSSILYYDQKGQPDYQDYLNENGVPQIREYLYGHKDIVIFPQADVQFSKNHYKNWEELMAERLHIFQQQRITKEDVLVIASDSQHDELLFGQFKEQKKVASFFSYRQPKPDVDAVLLALSQVESVVVDTEGMEESILSCVPIEFQAEIPLLRLPSFDTRLRLGNSQTMEELLIYWHIDSLSHQDIKEIVPFLLGYLAENASVTLKMVTYQKDVDLQAWSTYIRQQILDKYDSQVFFRAINRGGENQLEEDQEERNGRVTIEQLTNESQVIALLDKARLVLDLGEKPDVYTQIASISAGIPQINRVQTEYVDHGKNGLIITGKDQLQQALSHYLDGLANWNQSLVYAVQKMGDYTSGRLLEQWKAELAGTKKKG